MQIFSPRPARSIMRLTQALLKKIKRSKKHSEARRQREREREKKRKTKSGGRLTTTKTGKHQQDHANTVTKKTILYTRDTHKINQIPASSPLDPYSTCRRASRAMSPPSVHRFSSGVLEAGKDSCRTVLRTCQGHASGFRVAASGRS